MRFYSEEQQREYDEAMLQESMTQGEWNSAALSQYAAVAGAEDAGSQWVLSPYDTWERNPHYHGPEQRHPEE